MAAGSPDLFVDTGAWFAINVPGDKHHQAAADFYKSALKKGKGLVTTNLIVAEAHAGLIKARGRQAGLKFLSLVDSSSRLRVVYSTRLLEERAFSILVKFQDREFSLCDAVSFAVMKEMGIKTAFAFDRRFETAGFRRLP